MSRYKGDKLADGTPLNQAVYRAYRNAGLSHNQALAVTAEVGRENGFQAKYIFGGHIDPAGAKGGGTIQNTGMLSWNGNRGASLQRHLSQKGLLSKNGMARTQATLDAQAKFAVNEMKSDTYRGKLKHFWNNPNADPESFAQELGKNYIVWAYGQNSIRGKNGGRVAFDWKSHDDRRRGHLGTLTSMVGGGQNATPTPSVQAPRQPFKPQLLSMAQIMGKAPMPSINTPQQQPKAVEQAKQQALLVAIMGDYRLKDTGIGSGDHYDLRLARNADGTRGDINPYLNRFLVNNKGLDTYRQTGRYMEQRKGYRHQGVDFGINGSFGGDVNARKLYVNPQYNVKDMKSFFDKHGGGWVTQVHFDDDVRVNILHQNQKGANEVMTAWGGRQNTPTPSLSPAVPRQERQPFKPQLLSMAQIMGGGTTTSKPTFKPQLLSMAQIKGGQL